MQILVILKTKNSFSFLTTLQLFSNTTDVTQ